MSRIYSSDEHPTCWDCRRTKDICLDCPKATCGNHYNHYGNGRRYKIHRLNRLEELGMIERPEFLPKVPITQRDD